MLLGAAAATILPRALADEKGLPAAQRVEEERAAARAQRAADEKNVPMALRVQAVLESKASSSERIARLESLGPAAVPVLLAILDADMVPFDSLETAKHVFDGDHEGVIVAALKRFHRGELSAPIEQAAAGTVRVRRASIEALGTVGDRRDFPLLCRLASPAAPNDDLEGSIASALQRASTDILLRDFGAYLSVQDVLRRQLSATRICLYRALADTSSSQSLPILVGRLGAERSEDAILLSEIVRASRWVPLPPEIGVREGVRLYLHSDRPGLVQAAATILGNLEDPDAVSELIERLADADSFVRKNAHTALCRITGEMLLPDRNRWTAWYEAECAWYRERADACILDLGNENGIRKNVALSEISKHALYREEFTVHVLRMLPRESPALQRLGICALGLMGSTSAVPYLEATATDADPELAAGAREALERIRQRRPQPSKPALPRS